MNPSTPQTIRWGIIGCGAVCEIKSGPGFQKADHSERVMVMRRDAAKAQDYATRHNVPHWTTDATELINSPLVDAVYIATPVGTHASYALQVAAAGKPCYIEKPMTRNFAEAMQIVNAFEAKNLPVFAAYYRRQLPRFVKAKELLDANAIGTITGLHVAYATNFHQRVDPKNPPWRIHAEHAGGGLFFDLASHALDVIDYMVGPLNHVSGQAQNITQVYDVEEIVSLRFGIHNTHGVGTGLWNFASQTHEDHITIYGTQGKLAMACFAHPRLTLITQDDEQIFDLPDPPHVQQPLIQSIVNELNGNGQCPSTARSAARTANVMDIATMNYYGSREDQFWTTPENWPRRSVIN